MNKSLKIILIALFIFVGVTGGLISNKEYIPDNAKIFVIEEYQLWIPNAKWADKIFQEQSSQDPNAKRSYDIKVESTYFEVKNGKYKGFQLPKSWEKEDGTARIVWGKDESLLRSWILPKQNRWNVNGSWNW
jgi:hypothetical protein